MTTVEESGYDDDHWTPPQILVGGVALAHAGRLFVVHDRRGRIYRHDPLAGMAAVEHRYPPWARGPFGVIEPERPVPVAAGLFALVEAGTLRYVGAATDLAREFGPRGFGSIRRRDCDDPRREEACRVNHHVVAAAVAGRSVDAYLAITAPMTRLDEFLGRDRTPRAERDRLRALVSDPWT